jgi:hypothetical protein
MKKAILLVVVMISLATYTSLRYGGAGGSEGCFSKGLS